MKHATSILLVTTLAAALAGCSDPKAATKDNFTKAVNTMLSDNKGECLYFTNGKLPIEGVVIQDSANPSLKQSATELLKRPEAFVKLGFLKVSGESKNSMGVMMRHYDLTEEGVKHYNSFSRPFGSSGGFCYAPASVERMDEPPAPSTSPDGVTATTASFAVKVGKAKKWASDSEIQTLFKGQIAAEGTVHDDKALIIKTVDGWKAQKS